MPYRDRAQVERWLADFWDSHSLFGERLTILDDEFIPHHNSGVVVVGLEGSPGLTYLRVKIVDGVPCWMVTFEARSETLHMDATGLRDFAHEIGALGILCDYLQSRTDEARRSAATA